MRNRDLYQPHPDHGERTAVIERDIRHLGERMSEFAGSISATNSRLHGQSTRLQSAEHRIANLVETVEHIQASIARIPDIETVIRIFQWVYGAIKVMAGIAIVAAALAKGQGAEALLGLFG